MRSTVSSRVLSTLFLIGFAFPVLTTAQGLNNFSASLSGFEEVPVVLTTGEGRIIVEIAPDQNSLSYDLSYSGLEGNVLQSHIHAGQFSVNGGIMVFFCTNLGNNPDAPACPASPGSVSGTVMAADVVGPSGQGVTASEFAEVIRAIRAGTAYANVHSDKFPGGEIRGQLEPGQGEGHR